MHGCKLNVLPGRFLNMEGVRIRIDASIGEASATL